MSYELGIDLGTTYTAAAVHRDGRVEIVTLGNRAASIPSVVFLTDDETILTGDPANRRAVTEPDRVAREFKRRFGDSTPVLLGNTPLSPQALMAKLLRWTVDVVAEREGGPPGRLALTHPANWGAFKKDLLDQAVRLADLTVEVERLTEPEAAAIFYASNERVDPGSVVAVYDLGGGTFDAAVLRKNGDRWEILGEPEGIEHLGGIDFDEAVFNHVRSSLSDEFEALDATDPAVLAAVDRIRQDCVDAKEALSNDTDVSVPVLLPTVQTEVRLTRAEFESMIRPTLQETVGALRRALRSAGVEAGEVSAVLLVGGSSRIPLVSQLVSGEFGRPVAVDAHPKHAIALGAAIAASTPGAEVPDDVEVAAGTEPETPAAGAPEVPSGDVTGPTVDGAEPSPEAPPTGDAEPESEPAAEPPAEPESSPSESAEDAGERKKTPVGLLAGIGAVIVVVIVAVIALGGGGGDDSEPAAATEDAPAETANDDDAAPAETTTTLPEGPFAMIESIEVASGRYLFDYDAIGFTPIINDAGAYHVHFFWDTLPVVNAGANGPDPGRWLLWDTPFTVDDAFFDVSGRPSGARQICAVVVNNSHELADVDLDGKVDTDTGSCIDLPDA